MSEATGTSNEKNETKRSLSLCSLLLVLKRTVKRTVKRTAGQSNQAFVQKSRMYHKVSTFSFSPGTSLDDLFDPAAVIG
jgi:hypothetical protein